VFATLTKTMAGDQNWSGQNIALGGIEGEQEFHVMKSTPYSSFNRPVDAQNGANCVARTCPVQVRRPDAVLGARSLENTLLKVDTQGYEMQVFRGLGKGLASIRAVLCEVSVNALYEGIMPMQDVVAFLCENGLKPAFFAPMGRMSDLSAREFDYYCVRP